MDPKATLALLLECIRDNDLDSAAITLDDLTDWIKQGGFIPADDINRALEALKK